MRFLTSFGFTCTRFHHRPGTGVEKCSCQGNFQAERIAAQLGSKNHVNLKATQELNLVEDWPEQLNIDSSDVMWKF